MGAAAVMLYASRNPSLPIIVLDSPFTSLE